MFGVQLHTRGRRLAQSAPDQPVVPNMVCISVRRRTVAHAEETGIVYDGCNWTLLAHGAYWVSLQADFLSGLDPSSLVCCTGQVDLWARGRFARPKLKAFVQKFRILAPIADFPNFNYIVSKSP